MLTDRSDIAHWKVNFLSWLSVWGIFFVTLPHMLFSPWKVSTSILWLSCRPYTPQKEQQIPSAHQTGVQGRTAESTANWSNDPPHPPQCFKKALRCCLRSPWEWISNFKATLKMHRPTHARKSCYCAIFLYLFFFFFLPVSPLFLSFLLTLWLHVGVLSGWAVSCHTSTYVWVLFSPLLLIT